MVDVVGGLVAGEVVDRLACDVAGGAVASEADGMASIGRPEVRVHIHAVVVVVVGAPVLERGAADKLHEPEDGNHEGGRSHPQNGAPASARKSRPIRLSKMGPGTAMPATLRTIPQASWGV